MAPVSPTGAALRVLLEGRVMVRRALRAGPAVSLLGTLLLLAGLVWDGALHRADPGLAAREGVFSLGAAAHQVIAAGLAASAGGAALWLLGLFGTAGSRWALRAGAGVGLAAVLGLFGLSFAVAAPSAFGAAGEHDHQAVASREAAAQPAQATPAPVRRFHVHGNTDPATATDADRAGAEKLLNDTRAGAARFADFSVAEAEGYVEGRLARSRPIGPAHYLNPAYVSDGALLDPTRPEGLVYLKLPDGRKQLLGVFYVAPYGQGPTPGGPLTVWHTHAEQPGPGAREMLHVWLFDHPNGPFAHGLNAEALRVAFRAAGLTAQDLRAALGGLRRPKSAPGAGP